MSIKYKLDAFEGPLDLLLHLIDKNELDIYDIPIVQITEQYLGYIREMPQLELEVTTEFLVMAATLLSIKSKMLLPKPPVLEEMSDLPEEDPRFELVQRLLEYRKFKDLADRLKDRELARSLIFSREPIDFNQYAPEQVEDPLKGLSLADIMFTFQNVVKRTIVKNRVAKIQRDERSVKDQINKLLGYFQKEGDRMMFSAILEDECERENIVVTFLAILELMKMRRITCFQHELFEDIVIQYRGGGRQWMESNQMKSIIEGLLFASGDEGLEAKQIAEALDVERSEVVKHLRELQQTYMVEQRGMQIVEWAGSFQMTTIPEHVSYFQKLAISPTRASLSQAALETLSIVAYRQPVTRADIEEIRGVNVDRAVHTLVAKGLIQDIGRADLIGRPILYGTTKQFLDYFGLGSIRELPDSSDWEDVVKLEQETKLLFERLDNRQLTIDDVNEK